MEKSYLLIILRLFAILKTQFGICRLQDWHSYFKLSYEAESTWKSLQEGHEANMKPSQPEHDRNWSMFAAFH